MSKYVIIGSGISGCTAAGELANQGNDVELIEARNTIGGAILGYTCKATDECSRCGVCVAHTQLHEALKRNRVTISVGTSIKSVSNNGKNIDLIITRKNPSISYHRCISCDTCVHACPEQCITKIQRGEFVQYIIDYTKCLLHKSTANVPFAERKQCTVCADVCPTRAIFAKTATTEMAISADAALIAIGHEPYDASQKVRFGYGRINNVITGVEAEEMLSRQTYLGSPSDSIAFIQCVGSRDPQIGRNYCSSVCCAYALRLARIIKYRNTDTPVTIYYIDIQNFDKTFTLFRKAVEDSGVHFVRGVPFSVERSSTGKLKLQIANMDGEDSIVEHDIVVLSVGMGPAHDSEKLASLFGLKRDEFGFFSSSLPNVFVSGTCQEPLSIPDSMASARAIALEMGKL
jgi:heterodisulfide reductase subunit A